MSVSCRDCRWADRSQKSRIRAWIATLLRRDPERTITCQMIRRRNPLTGRDRLQPCADARASFGFCGPEGRLFVPDYPRQESLLELAAGGIGMLGIWVLIALACALGASAARAAEVVATTPPASTGADWGLLGLVTLVIVGLVAAVR